MPRRPLPWSAPEDRLLDENPKNRHHYGFFPGIPSTILEASREEHARLRGALLPGFSDKALRAQELRIWHYVDLLIRRLWLHAEAGPGGSATLDMVKWYNRKAFDILGDLIFAESFECLEKEKSHPFMPAPVGPAGTILVVLNYIGMAWLTQLLCIVVIRRMVFGVRGVLMQKLQRRLSAKVEMENLFEGFMRHREEWVSIISSHSP